MQNKTLQSDLRARGQHLQTIYFLPRALEPTLSLTRPLLAPRSTASLLDASTDAPDATASSLVDFNNSSMKKSGMAHRLLMRSSLLCELREMNETEAGTGLCEAKFCMTLRALA